MVKLDSAESVAKHLKKFVNGQSRNEDKLHILADALAVLAKDVAEIKKTADNAAGPN